MRAGETSQEHELISPVGKLRVTWELYRPDYGNTITIQTGEIDCPAAEALTAFWRCHLL